MRTIAFGDITRDVRKDINGTTGRNPRLQVGLRLGIAFCLAGMSMGVGSCTGGGTGPLEPGFESSFEYSGGCGDMLLYASNVEDTILMTFIIDGLSEQAHTQGGQVSETASLPDSRIQLEVRVGEKLSDTVCDDVAEGGTHVDATYEAVTGSADILVVPEGSPTDYGGYPAKATVILSDIELQNLEDVTDIVELPSYSWSNVFIGWLPG